jgi:hypothetical protein
MESLPNELLLTIFGHIPETRLILLARTCMLWRDLIYHYTGKDNFLTIELITHLDSSKKCLDLILERSDSFALLVRIKLKSKEIPKERDKILEGIFSLRDVGLDNSLSQFEWNKTLVGLKRMPHWILMVFPSSTCVAMSFSHNDAYSIIKLIYLIAGALVAVKLK